MAQITDSTDDLITEGATDTITLVREAYKKALTIMARVARGDDFDEDDQISIFTAVTHLGTGGFKSLRRHETPQLSLNGSSSSMPAALSAGSSQPSENDNIMLVFQKEGIDLSKTASNFGSTLDAAEKRKMTNVVHNPRQIVAKIDKLEQEARDKDKELEAEKKKANAVTIQSVDTVDKLDRDANGHYADPGKALSKTAVADIIKELNRLSALEKAPKPTPPNPTADTQLLSKLKFKGAKVGHGIILANADDLSDTERTRIGLTKK